MKYLTLSVIAILGAFAFLTTSYAKDISVKELLPGYIAIQEALADDELSLAKQKANELEKQAKNAGGKELKAVKASLSIFQKAKSLSDARKEFKKLSAPFVKWMGSNKSSEFDIVYCSMAEAKWVQKKGEVLNPYFGKEMLRCGEKTM